MKQLSLIERAFFLKKTRLFSELDLESLLAVAEKLHHDDYDTEEKVFTPGQVANRIYLIVQGNVQLFCEKGQPLTDLQTGDFFGDESLFNEKPRTYSAICKTDCLFLTLSRSHLLSVISECPAVAVVLLQAYSQRFPCRHRQGATHP